MKLFRKSLNGAYFEFSLLEVLKSFFVIGLDVYGCTKSGFVRFNPNNQSFKNLVGIEEDVESNRNNDVKLDGGKNFIFGAMSNAGNKKPGKLIL